MPTTCVDANPIFDLVLIDSQRHDEARSTLSGARVEGDLAISEPVYAELAARMEADVLSAFLRDAGIILVRSTLSVLVEAGRAWSRYTGRRRHGLECSNCGRSSRPSCPGCREPLRSRQHLITDFIVGAHAMANGGRLITRDRGYYGTYFPDLTLV